MRLYIFLFLFITCLSAEAQKENTAKARKRIMPLICGHRGGFYDQFPENSFAAIDNTVRNCNSTPVIVEVDVRKSNNGTLFILHDETLDRTTNGTGLISEADDTYLKSLYLKNRSGDLTNEKLPTFDSLVNYSKTRDIIIMLDIKADAWGDVIEKLKEAKLIHKCIVLTFSPTDTKTVFDFSHDIKISCLIKNEGDWALIKELSIPTQNLIAYTNLTTSQNLISELKNNLMLIMTDVSESSTRNVTAITKDFYLDFIRKRRIDILITDFPVDVSNKIR